MRFVFAFLAVVTLALAALTCGPWALPRPDPAGLSAAVEMSQIPDVVQRFRILGYERAEFGRGWEGTSEGCTVRDVALAQLFASPLEECGVQPWHRARDPYGGRTLAPHDAIEIDHVFPLSAAWDLGAFRWDPALRRRFANDPLNLVATSRAENQAKSDSLPSQWQPSDRRARCWYARRLAVVATRYGLPLPSADLAVMRRACPPWA